MGQDRWTDVDRYLEALLVPADADLDAALDAAAAAGLPAHGVSALQGRLLLLLARAVGAWSILELGTLGGYSTIWLGRALPATGRLVTLEIDPGYAAVARASLARAGLAEIVDVRVGPALEGLAALEAEGVPPFDLIFLDADKGRNDDYLAAALRLARPGTLLVADNVVRGGTVLDAASADPTVRGVRRFHERVGAEPRLLATAIQTVGEKGHDGLTIALVTEG